MKAFLRKVCIRKTSGRLAVAALCAAALAAHPALAQVPQTVGGTDTGTPFPFGGDQTNPGQVNYQGEFQQIYNSAAFGITPFVIQQLAFSTASPSSSSDPFALNMPETVKYAFTISLGYTTSSATSASTSFAANKGAGYTTVFTSTVIAPLTASLTATDTFDLTIPLQTAFVYVPSGGNLLLDVVLTSADAGPTGQTDFFQAGDDPNVGTIAYQNGTSATPVDFSPQFGLLTRFSAAPEPTSFLTLGLGILMVGGCALIARRRVTRVASGQ